MHRFEVLADRKAEPRALDALERAVTRMMADDANAPRDVEVGESGGRLLIRMDLPAGSVRRARRRGERIFAQVWYDAFGEREPRHEGRVVGLGA